MRLYQLLALSCLGLTTLIIQPLAGEEVAADEQAAAKPAKGDAAEDDSAEDKAADNQADAAAEPPQQAAAQPNAQPNPKPRRSRVPKHAATPNPRAQPTPQSILTDQQMFVPEAMAKPQQHANQGRRQQQARQQPIPARQMPNPQFGAPRQQGLSPAAAYRYQSMGNHLYLSPAMRMRLDPYRPNANAQPTISRSGLTKVPGQGAEKFYPGVSRLPQQKPFANIERPPSGLQSYWPLLLEGREDQTTGDIIWTLP